MKIRNAETISLIFVRLKCVLKKIKNYQEGKTRLHLNTYIHIKIFNSATTEEKTDCIATIYEKIEQKNDVKRYH